MTTFVPSATFLARGRRLLRRHTPRDADRRVAARPPDRGRHCAQHLKKKRQEERTADTQIAEIREAFWQSFDAALATDRSLSECQRRYGGRLGFQWIFP